MKRRIRQNIYGNWKGYVGREMVWDFGVDEVQAEAWLATGLTDSRSEEGARAWNEARERVQKRKYGSNPMKKFREPFHVNFHSERGEVSIHVTDADDREVWYADTDTVNELVEDGFLDTRGFVMGRNLRPDVLEQSVLDYLRSVGVIADRPDRGHSRAVSRMIDDNVCRGYENLDKISRMNAPTVVDDDEDPRGRRRNPGDVHIDIHSHNTRGSNVRAKNPQRPRRGNPLIRTVADFRKALSDGPYAWPGGYPLFFVTADGGALSFKTAKENQSLIEDSIASRDRHSGWCVEGVDVNWEDNDLYDDHSGEKIESAYGENPSARRKNPLPIQLGDRVIDREMPQEGVMTVIGFADGGETVKVQYRNGTTDFVGREFLRVVFPENSRRENPTREDVDGWVDHYRESMEKRIDGVPEKAHYVVKIVTKDGQDAWLRVGKGTKFDTDPAKARVYRNGDKANEAATKVANWLKKKQPAKWKKIATISAEPKK